MALLSVTIRDTRTGQEERRPIEKRQRPYHGVIIGSAEDCDVRLVAPGVSAHHVRWYPGGYHAFLEVLDADAVVTSETGAECRSGEHLRIDRRSFKVGPYLLTL